MFVAFVGAVIVIVAQRKVWAHAQEREPRTPVTGWSLDRVTLHGPGEVYPRRSV